MKLTRIAVYTALLLAALGTVWQLGKRNVAVVHAQTSITIPKAWGTLKGTALNGADYVFEASDGTIRVVAMDTGKVDATAKRE
jgi:TRAP-type mannitol/chloroaromatic compound transport system substrate-binding protein